MIEMEWVWAFISVFWTFGVWMVVRTALAMGKRWDEAGFIANGLGTRIERATNPLGFSLARWGIRFFAAFGVLFVLGGIAVTIGWIVKAI
ncbi:hypothetical protein [Sphingopyxis sp. R3-92]|uniref:hypothetical protein n=1 Tax=Sphingopyxis sp. R3-92 TaxID=3158553 RepID=UPI003EE73DAF